MAIHPLPQGKEFSCHEDVIKPGHEHRCISYRTMLSVEGEQDPFHDDAWRLHPCLAVNDLVLDIGEPFRAIDFKVFINNHELASVRGDQEIRIQIHRTEGAWAIIDGQERYKLKFHEKTSDWNLFVKSAEQKMQIMEHPHHNHWETLVSKLHWGS